MKTTTTAKISEEGGEVMAGEGGVGESLPLSVVSPSDDFTRFSDLADPTECRVRRLHVVEETSKKC